MVERTYTSPQTYPQRTVSTSSGGTGGASTWADISGKPTTYPPSAHSHIITDVTGLQAALDAKQVAGTYATGTGSANGANTGDQFTNMTSSRILGRATAGFGPAEQLTGAQVQAMLDLSAYATASSLSNYVTTANFTWTNLAGKPTSFTDSATPRLAASAVSTFGLTLIDDADAAAARATLGAQVAGSYQPAGNYALGGGTATGTNTGDQVLPTRASLGLATTDDVQFRDVRVQRPAAPTTGVIHFGNDTGGQHYLFYDGTNFYLKGAPLVIENGSIFVPDDPYSAAWDTSTQVPTKNAIYNKIQSMSAGADAADAAPFTLLDVTGSHTAARAAGTYWLGQGQPAGLTGVGTLYPPNLIYLDPVDYPARGNYTAKLRVRLIISVNDVAPGTNFVIALHPVTKPATSGAAGLVIHTVGAAVAGTTVTATAPAADSMARFVSAEFAVPAAGFYCIGFVTNAAVAASSHVHLSGRLVLRYA